MPRYLAVTANPPVVALRSARRRWLAGSVTVRGAVSAPVSTMSPLRLAWVAVSVRSASPMATPSVRFALLSRASKASLAVTSFWFWEAAMCVMPRLGVGISEARCCGEAAADGRAQLEDGDVDEGLRRAEVRSLVRRGVDGARTRQPRDGAHDGAAGGVQHVDLVGL